MGELENRIHKTSLSSFSLVIPNLQDIKGYLKKDFRPVPLTFMIRPARLSNYFYDRKMTRQILKPLDLIWRKKKKSIQNHT
jgi:hypothetical protein